MPGRYGLMIVIFAALVWVARSLDLGSLRQLDIVWLQVVNLLFCAGLASCIVGLLGQYWALIRRPD